MIDLFGVQDKLLVTIVYLSSVLHNIMFGDDDNRVKKSKNFPDSTIFVAKNFPDKARKSCQFSNSQQIPVKGGFARFYA